MIPAAFGYTRVGSVDEALRILASDPDAKVIAGGQSLVPLMKLRLASPATLVDIGRIPELRGIRRLEDGRLGVGSLTTYAELADSPAIHYGVLRDALPRIGDVQVRNRGTVGGAVAHADPASDLPAALLALDAELVLLSPDGERHVPADGFFQSAFTTSLRHDELLVEVRLPPPRDDTGSAYASLEVPASGYAMVGVAAVAVVGAGGMIERLGVGVTGVSDRAVPGEGGRGGADRDDRRSRGRRGRRGAGRGRAPRERGHPRRLRLPGRDGGRHRPAGDHGGAGARRLTGGRRISGAAGEARADHPGPSPAAGPAGRDPGAGPRARRRAPGEGTPSFRRRSGGDRRGAGRRPVTVLVADPGEVPEDEAARRLAVAVAGGDPRASPCGVRCSRAWTSSRPPSASSRCGCPRSSGSTASTRWRCSPPSTAGWSRGLDVPDGPGRTRRPGRRPTTREAPRRLRRRPARRTPVSV